MSVFALAAEATPGDLGKAVAATVVAGLLIWGVYSYLGHYTAWTEGGKADELGWGLVRTVVLVCAGIFFVSLV